MSMLLWKRKKFDIIIKYLVDTGRKLNVHKTFRRRPGRLLNVLRTFNLRPVSTGIFVTKTIRKAIMKRSKQRNTVIKKRSSENLQNYKRQRNICSNIMKSIKKTFFGNLNINETTNSKNFWRTVKSFFSKFFLFFSFSLFFSLNVRPAATLF